MLAITLILGCITASLLLLHWYQTRSRFARMINKFPQPPMPPIIGHVLKFSTKQDVLFGQLRKVCKSYSETFCLWSAYLSSLNIITADDAEIILSSMKYIDKSIGYDFMMPWLGTGLLTSTGAKWQHRRKILTPTFHFNILQKFVPIFGEHSQEFVAELKSECKKSKTNIVPLITNLTLGVICETAMGTKLDKNDKTQNNYFKALQNLSTLVVHRIVSPWLYLDVAFNMSPTGWKHNKYIKILHNFTAKIIKAREAKFKDGDISDLDNHDIGIKKRRLAMLDLLLSAKINDRAIDDEGIREEVDTFMFEGHDTTAAAVCLGLLTLASHKDIQEKIIAEMDQIFGKSKRIATYDDLMEMKYLELCIKEILRLYPSVPYISRVLKEDVQLTHHVAPAGTVILLHIYNVHRDPKIYPDPEKFDPDRFLPENSVGRHPYAYVPFSAGPRNCIGQKFAMLELKSILSSIFRNFTLECVDTVADLEFIVDAILRTKGAMNVKFKSRE